MLRSQIRGGFCLTAKTRDSELCRVFVDCAQHLSADKLYRGGAREHAMRGFVDFAHSSATKQLTELVAAHLSRLRDLLAELGHNVGYCDRGAHQYEIWIVH